MPQNEVSLTPEQIAYTLHIARQMVVSGYVLEPFELFEEYFSSKDKKALVFVLSTNGWKMRLDTILELVVVEQDHENPATWPIDQLKKQLDRMRRRGTTEEYRKK